MGCSSGGLHQRHPLRFRLQVCFFFPLAKTVCGDGLTTPWFADFDGVRKYEDWCF